MLMLVKVQLLLLGDHM